MPHDTAAAHDPDELVPAGLTCDRLTLAGRQCVEPLDADGSCPADAGHDPSGESLVPDGTARRLTVREVARPACATEAALARADAADPGPEAWRRVIAPDDEDEPADAPAPRPAPRHLAEDPRDVHPEQAGSPNTLRAVALHRDRYALAEDDTAQYVVLSRAHGDLADALDSPLAGPWSVPAALVAVAARGLAWLDTLAPGDVLRVIAGERLRQRRKHPEATLDLPGWNDPARFVVLAEEVGEVANALTYDEGDPDNLVREIVQVVALALAWLDGLDEREGTVR